MLPRHAGFDKNGLRRTITAHGINANIVHRWLRERACQFQAVAPQEFLPLTLEAAAAPAKAERDIRIEVRRSTGSVTVNWPLEGAASCAAWLRDWLR